MVPCIISTEPQKWTVNLSAHQNGGDLYRSPAALFK